MELYNGDCLQVMDDLIAKGIKVDCIITDPPYGISRKNNFQTMGRSGIDFGNWDKNFDFYSWLDRADKILNKNGSLLFFSDWKNIGELAKYCENNLDFDIKDLFRWEKTNPMPKNRDRRYITDFELGCWLVKRKGKWVFNRQDNNFERPKIINKLVLGKEKTIHPTQKPILVMEHLIRIHTNENDLILDPFMGSGSTGLACKNLNRQFIGIELDKTYFEIAKNKIEFGASNGT